MRKNRFLILAVAAMMTMSSMTGCDIKTDTPIIGKIAGLDGDEIFQIDELICTKEEYLLMFMNTQNQYKKNLGTGIDWNAIVEGEKTLQEVVKEQTREELSVIYTLAAWAEKEGVELSEAESTAISSAAKDFYNGMADEERDYTDAGMKDVENLYSKFFLADKIKDHISGNAGEDISDEQARVIQIQYIHMSTENTTEKKIKSTLKEVTDVVNGGYQEFIREAKQYSLDETLDVTLKKNEATKKFELEAFNLNDGEISKIIKDGSNYYLVYCVSSYLEEDTEKNKQAMIEAVKQELLKIQYEEYLSSIKTDFNTSVWTDLDVSTDNKVNTTDLMTVYQTMEIS